MKISVVNIVMLGSGVILLYSGIKGYDPRDVLKWGMGGKKPKQVYGNKEEKQEPKVNPKDHPGDMPWTYPDKNGDGWPDGKVV